MKRFFKILSILIIGFLVGFHYRKTQSFYNRWKEQHVTPIICHYNLRVIDDAKTQWAIENHKAAADTPTWHDLFGTNRYYIAGRQPVCPSGGAYILGRVDERPRCTLPSHNTP